LEPDTALPPPPEAVVDPPPGWHRWQYPPKDCAIFVPDDLKTVEPLIWETCPFQPVGCRRATSPWVAQTGGWGFGATLSVAYVSGSTYVRTSRYLPDYWLEILLLRDDALISAGRYQQGGSQCYATPWVGSDGRALMVVNRYRRPVWPWVFLGRPETIASVPERTETFEPPSIPSGATGRATWSNELLVVWDQGRFAIRDLQTGATERPKPLVGGEGADAIDPVPIGRAVYYISGADRGAICVRVPPSLHAQVLGDDAASYDNFITDGTSVIWSRAGKEGPLQYEYGEMEVWTSPVPPASDPTKLVPRRLASDLGRHIPQLSIGEGWAAVRLSDTDVRLYRISDGLQRRLPAVEGLSWAGWQYEGLVIAGGAVWVVTRIWPGSNMVRYITRFEIDSLPPPLPGPGPMPTATATSPAERALRTEVSRPGASLPVHPRPP
jgi:hypothetical protein